MPRTKAHRSLRLVKQPNDVIAREVEVTHRLRRGIAVTGDDCFAIETDEVFVFRAHRCSLQIKARGAAVRWAGLAGRSRAVGAWAAQQVARRGRNAPNGSDGQQSGRDGHRDAGVASGEIGKPFVIARYGLRSRTDQ
jgi:hypothetical protein